MEGWGKREKEKKEKKEKKGERRIEGEGKENLWEVLFVNNRLKKQSIGDCSSSQFILKKKNLEIYLTINLFLKIIFPFVFFSVFSTSPTLSFLFLFSLHSLHLFLSSSLSFFFLSFSSLSFFFLSFFFLSFFFLSFFFLSKYSSYIVFIIRLNRGFKGNSTFFWFVFSKISCVCWAYFILFFIYVFIFYLFIYLICYSIKKVRLS